MEIGTTEILIVILILEMRCDAMPCHALRVSGSRPSTS